MMNWPDNKRIAVMMAFDLDAETMWTTHGDGSTAHMTNLSRGAYGPKQGVPRILDMLDSHQVKATFFIPGVVAEHYPEVVREIARRDTTSAFMAICMRNPQKLPMSRKMPPCTAVRRSSTI